MSKATHVAIGSTQCASAATVPTPNVTCSPKPIYMTATLVTGIRYARTYPRATFFRKGRDSATTATARARSCSLKPFMSKPSTVCTTLE
eukprot:2890368-Prymnesium_polylepis.2